jgi:hypothetical protein
MVYKKIANEEGNYKDSENARFHVLEAHSAYTPQGLNVGWDEYPDLQSALTAYGLTYDPLPEGENQ